MIRWGIGPARRGATVVDTTAGAQAYALALAHRPLAAADKIVARATTAPAEALSLGILPSDVTALEQGVTSLQAAEATATHNATVRAQFAALAPKKKG